MSVCSRSTRYTDVRELAVYQSNNPLPGQYERTYRGHQVLHRDALLQVLPDQAVRILVAAALPGMMRLRVDKLRAASRTLTRSPARRAATRSSVLARSEIGRYTWPTPTEIPIPSPTPARFVRLTILIATLSAVVTYAVATYPMADEPSASVTNEFLLRVPQGSLHVRPDLPVNTKYQKDYFFRQNWFSEANVQVWVAALADLKDKPGLSYLEVGVYEGRSFFWVLENIMTHPTSRLTGIDPFFENGDTVMTRWGNVGNYPQIFRRNLRLSGAQERITVITGFSQTELRKLEPASYDLIYIDGSHATRDVLEDAVLSWHLLKEGGILIFDDYLFNSVGDSKRDPMIAVDVFYSFFSDDIEVVFRGYQVILKKRAA